jgi:hypothetical protein
LLHNHPDLVVAQPTTASDASALGHLRPPLASKEVSLKLLHKHSFVKTVIMSMGMLGISTVPVHAQPATYSNITVHHHAHRDEALPVHGNALSSGGAMSD